MGSVRIEAEIGMADEESGSEVGDADAAVADQGVRGSGLWPGGRTITSLLRLMRLCAAEILLPAEKSGNP